VSSRPERLELVRPDAPLDLVAAIDHAMDPDPTRRPTAEELGASLAGEEELASETTTVPVIAPAEADAETMAVSAVGAGPMATVATPVVAPVANVRRGWRERRAVVATVAIAAALGLLLLAASDHAGSTGNPEKADVTTVPTTAGPPTTVASQVTAQVRTVVTSAPKPVDRHHGGKGKHGRD